MRYGVRMSQIKNFISSNHEIRQTYLGVTYGYFREKRMITLTANCCYVNEGSKLLQYTITGKGR